MVSFRRLARTGAVETERQRIARLLFGPWPHDVPDPGPGDDEEPAPEPLTEAQLQRLLAVMEEAVG